MKKLIFPIFVAFVFLLVACEQKEINYNSSSSLPKTYGNAPKLIVTNSPKLMATKTPQAGSSVTFPQAMLLVQYHKNSSNYDTAEFMNIDDDGQYIIQSTYDIKMSSDNNSFSYKNPNNPNDTVTMTGTGLGLPPNANAKPITLKAKVVNPEGKIIAQASVQAKASTANPKKLPDNGDLKKMQDQKKIFEQFRDMLASELTSDKPLQPDGATTLYNLNFVNGQQITTYIYNIETGKIINNGPSPTYFLICFDALPYSFFIGHLFPLSFINMRIPFWYSNQAQHPQLKDMFYPELVSYDLKSSIPHMNIVLTINAVILRTYQHFFLPITSIDLQKHTFSVKTADFSEQLSQMLKLQTSSSIGKLQKCIHFGGAPNIVFSFSKT